jgi:integrase
MGVGWRRPARGSAAARGLSDRGAHLEAFYGCLYYAALRPSEAVMLRELDSAYSAMWAEARQGALTEAQYRSPLGRRPYDLRHAAVSLWLNSGVPATEVARRAGHGVAVLLKIYAQCIDGQADAANQRITDALGTRDTQPEPGDEEDGEGEMAS